MTRGVGERVVRILMVTSAFPARRSDPRGTFIATLARALVEHGVQVTVVAPDCAGPTEAFPPGVKVVRARYWIRRWQGLAEGASGIVPNIRRNPLLLLQVPTFVLALCYHCIRLANKHDVVHAHWLYPAGLAGLLAKRLGNVPLVVTAHGGDLHRARGSAFLRTLAALVARAADHCLGVSPALAEELRQFGVDSERVKFLPLGVETKGEDGQPEQNLKASLPPGDRSLFTLLYVGSLIPIKSVDTLLEAHGLLQRQGSQLATVLVGAGPSEPSLRRIATQLKLDHVHFVGEQPPHTIPAWLRQADVLVLPSLAEGRGLVVVEAMAQGTPAVVSDVPGTRELIQSGGALGFPPGDSAALAKLVNRCMHDAALRRDTGAAGRRFVCREQLSPAESARQHLELYDRILSIQR